jgi:broad specificity phosphatase PhoE
MKITAIRHGETDWNAAGKIQGKTDIPLNDNGREQAHNTAQLLKRHDIDVIVSSPLKRAVETAETIADFLGINDEVITDSRISERDFGDYEGLLIQEIDCLALRRWTDNIPAPNGETIRDVAARVFECLDEVIERHEGHNILIVGHGHVLRTILWYFNGVPDGNEKECDFLVGNCEIFKFERKI